MQSKRLLYLQDNYAKKYEKVNNYFTLIIKYDPTSIVSGETIYDIKKVGKYSQWLLNQFLKESNELKFLNNLKTIKHNLNTFDRYKNILPKKDINQLSIEELDQVTKYIETKSKKSDKKFTKRAKKIKKLYEDERWIVVVPLTYSASRKLAKPPITKWCTAARLKNFKEYNEKGKLYIILDKQNRIIIDGVFKPKPVYQFHFKTNLFLNTDDKEFDLIEFLKRNKGLAEFFKPKFKKNILKYFDYKWIFSYKSIYKDDLSWYKIIDKTCKNILCDEKIIISDKNELCSQIISLIGGHDLFLKKIINFLSKDVKYLEITFHFYKESEEGFEISGSQLPKNLKFLRLNGFLKKIPEKLSELRKLSLISFANSEINTIPSDIYKLKRLELLDLRNTKIKKQIDRKTNFIIFY